jgi:hypothetical protein
MLLGGECLGEGGDDVAFEAFAGELLALFSGGAPARAARRASAGACETTTGLS